jgi:hypothetical protein
MIIFIGWLIGIICIFMFEFFWWRTLAADHEEMSTLGLGWGIAIIYLVGGIAGVVGVNRGVGNILGWWNNQLFSPVWGLVAAQIGVMWMGWVRDWKIWSVAEDVMPGIYGLTLVMLAGQAIGGSGGWLGVGLTGLALILYRYMSANYRGWVWYKSGKKGLVFMGLNAIYLAAWAGINWSSAGGLVEMLKLILMPIMSLILVIGLVILRR